MAAELICSGKFNDFLTGTILPITAYATIATMTLIAVSYAVGNLLSNPKFTLWSKTEIVQLFVSVASTLFIAMIVGTFCAADVAEIGGLFGITTDSANIYESAKDYLLGAGIYSHNAITVIRYQLEGYTVVSYFNALECDYPVGGGVGLGCFYGQGSNNLQPLGGYSASLAALNFAFNSAIMSHFTVMNFAFILLFVYRGFAFLLLPLGVFMRSMPYMRPFGSLMISVAFSFLLVYPLMLAVFGLMGDTILDSANGYVPEGISMSDYDESVFPDSVGSSAEMGASVSGPDYVWATYFNTPYPESPGDMDVTQVIAGVGFAATAFIAAVFFPTIALLATIASVAYLARLYGDEIDLSRLTQLV